MRAQQLADRFREAMLDGTWIAGTNFKHQLLEIDWMTATQKMGSLNTIAALTFHIDYYIAGVLNVLRGGNLDISDKYSFDFEPFDTEEKWKKMVGQIIQNSEQLVLAIESLSDEMLDDVFVDKKYGTYQRNIDGVIEHSYYHLGQLVFIRKMIMFNTNQSSQK